MTDTLNAEGIAQILTFQTCGDAARKGYNLLNPDDLARWGADYRSGAYMFEAGATFDPVAHILLYGTAPMADMHKPPTEGGFLDSLLSKDPA